MTRSTSEASIGNRAVLSFKLGNSWAISIFRKEMGTDIILNEALVEYIQDSIPPEPGVLKELRDITNNLGSMSVMQISWVQARFMQTLIQLTGAKTYLEIGTFTGYSAIAMAIGLPEDGRVITLDKDKRWTDIGKSYWESLGFKDKVNLYLGDATQSLLKLIETGYKEKIDIIFIDADKHSLQTYLNLSHKLAKPGGLILIDNVLWKGGVIDPIDTRKNTRSIIEFNKTLKNDPRFAISMIPVGDGMTLAIKLNSKIKFN